MPSNMHKNTRFQKQNSNLGERPCLLLMSHPIEFSCFLSHILYLATLLDRETTSLIEEGVSL